MKTLTYKKAISYIRNLVLCNSLPEIDASVWENLLLFDNDFDYNKKIYQYYITDCSESEVEWLKEAFPSLIFSYSEKLDAFILCVDHFGTIWEQVPCNCYDENICNVEKKVIL